MFRITSVNMSAQKNCALKVRNSRVV